MVICGVYIANRICGSKSKSLSWPNSLKHEKNAFENCSSHFKNC